MAWFDRDVVQGDAPTFLDEEAETNAQLKSIRLNPAPTNQWPNQQPGYKRGALCRAVSALLGGNGSCPRCGNEAHRNIPGSWDEMCLCCGRIREQFFHARGAL